MRKLLATLVLAALAAPHAAGAAPADKNKAVCISAYEQGQKLRHDGKLKDARAQLMVCMQDTCPALFRKDCDQWLNEVNQTMPSVVFAATGANGEDITDVTVSIDGEKVASALDGKAVQLDPGNHIVKYEHRDLPPIEQSVLIRVGEKNRALIAAFGRPKDSSDAPRPEVSRPVPAMTWVLGGLGVAALGSFAYFGLQGKSDADKLQDCKPYCEEDDVDSARKKLLIADISLGVGVLSLGAATWLLLSGPATEPREAPSTAVRLQLAPLPGGGFAGVSTRF